MSKPESKIYMCSGVRLDNRYLHTIHFEDWDSQLAYFEGKVVKTFSSYTYIRREWVLQVEASMSEARAWNYLYFMNEPQGKPYFYFINKVEYANERTVSLTIEMDVMQTHLFEYDLLPCFVERAHTPDDTFGKYTLDEGLETGELVDLVTSKNLILSSLCIMILATINPNYAETEEPVPALAGVYNGVFSGLKAWAVPANRWADWSKQLEALDKAGFSDGIVSMWMYPQSAITLGGEDTWEGETLCKVVQGANTDTGWATQAVPFQKTLAEFYSPKNKKLLTYPYNFLYASNNMGDSAVYRFERFTNDPYGEGVVNFQTVGCVSPEGAVKMVPIYYNGTGGNYEAGLTLGGFPSCAWDADVYKLWLAQNQNQHGLTQQSAAITMGVGGAMTIGSVLTGNLLGAAGGVATAYNGYQQIAGLNAQKRDMAIQPPQAKGNFSSNVNMTAGYHTFSYIQKCVDAEHAKVIDDFFTMYGYKRQCVMIPPVRVRPAFTYVKTIGCQIQASFCTEDMVKIENIFDNGITFWVDGNKVGDYRQDNTV